MLSNSIEQLSIDPFNHIGVFIMENYISLPKLKTALYSKQRGVLKLQLSEKVSTLNVHSDNPNSIVIQTPTDLSKCICYIHPGDVITHLQPMSTYINLEEPGDFNMLSDKLNARIAYIVNDDLSLTRISRSDIPKTLKPLRWNRDLINVMSKLIQEGMGVTDSKVIPYLRYSHLMDVHVTIPEHKIKSRELAEQQLNELGPDVLIWKNMHNINIYTKKPTEFCVDICDQIKAKSINSNKFALMVHKDRLKGIPQYILEAAK